MKDDESAVQFPVTWKSPIHPEMREAFPKKQMTNEELADALKARAKRTMSNKAQEEMREAAKRLRAMPEGD